MSEFETPNFFKKDYESNKLGCSVPLSLKVPNVVSLEDFSPDEMY